MRQDARALDGRRRGSAAVPVEVARRLGDRRRAADDRASSSLPKHEIADASGIVTVPSSVSDELVVQR